jgi:hypothetical protein
VGWFEDNTDMKEVLARPGIQALLAYRGPFQSLICERFWAVSRSRKYLRPFLEELDRRGIQFETVTPLGDSISQPRREKPAPIRPQVPSPAPIDKTAGYHVAKPDHLHFERMVHRFYIPMR